MAAKGFELSNFEVDVILLSFAVFEILLAYKELNDWKKAILKVLPAKKMSKLMTEKRLVSSESEESSTIEDLVTTTSASNTVTSKLTNTVTSNLTNTVTNNLTNTVMCNFLNSTTSALSTSKTEADQLIHEKVVTEVKSIE